MFRFIKRWIDQRREDKEREKRETENIIFRNRALLERFHHKDKIKTSETRGYSPSKRSTESSSVATPFSYTMDLSDWSSSDSCDSSGSSDSGSSSGDCGGSD